uniref:Uncharacterized protein n=1 Tax=Magallana gigas TaxID=29159 RepID=K1S1R2_MAGGI
MAGDNKNFVFSQPVEMEVNKQNKTEKEQPNKKEYDVLHVKAMFEGKDMAECFAVIYINHNKSNECVREEILGIKTNIAEIEASLQGANEDISDIHKKIIPEIKESVSSEKKSDSN